MSEQDERKYPCALLDEAPNVQTADQGRMRAPMPFRQHHLGNVTIEQMEGSTTNPTKAARGAELALKPELDLEDARRRLAEAAEEAKRLEDPGAGWEANEAWKRHLLTRGALEAQERRR